MDQWRHHPWLEHADGEDAEWQEERLELRQEWQKVSQRLMRQPVECAECYSWGRVLCHLNMMTQDRQPMSRLNQREGEVMVLKMSPLRLGMSCDPSGKGHNLAVQACRWVGIERSDIWIHSQWCRLVGILLEIWPDEVNRWKDERRGRNGVVEEWERDAEVSQSVGSVRHEREKR